MEYVGATFGLEGTVLTPNAHSCRLDGTTKQEDRLAQMKSFNEDTGPDGMHSIRLRRSLKCTEAIDYIDSAQAVSTIDASRRHGHHIDSCRHCYIIRQ